MNILYILSACLLSFVLFEIWQFYSNYNNIINFNTNYYNLQYGTGSFTNIDPNTYDPNDFITSIQQKYRCILDPSDSFYYAFSIYGYYSNDVMSRSLTFKTLNNCTNYSFNNTYNKIIYNACTLNPNSTDCLFIRNNL